GEDLLNFVQRLAPEIFRLQHLGFGLLHQFADRLNVGVLQAVIAAHREFGFSFLISGRRSSLADAVSISSSKLMKMFMWSFTSFAESPSASPGVIEPFVQTSTVSLS